MLTLQNTEAIRRIEEAIGYTFNDKRLLIQVLTRKTYLKIDPEAPDNEVLEFYGDTLMNYHVTNYFMSKYAHMLDDGLFFMRTVEQFTDMRSHYVCNRYLTDRIKAMGLARYLRAQNRDSELRRDGEKAYADIFESLVGAIYLDSYQNDNLIRAFILRQLGIEPKRLPDEIEAFDYDSLTAPAVTEVPTLEEPDTMADLPVEESIAKAEAVVESADTAMELIEAPSMEEAAAAELLATSDPVETPVAVETPAEEVVAVAATVVGPKQEALAEFCRQWGFDQPTYGETPPNAPNARPVAACTMKYKDAKGKLVKISLNDSGRTLAEATEKAAAKMLKKLEKQTIGNVSVSKPADTAPIEVPAEKEEFPFREVPTIEQTTPVAEVVVETAAETAAETAVERTVMPEIPVVEEVAEPVHAEETIPSESATTVEEPSAEEVTVEADSAESAEGFAAAAEAVTEIVPSEVEPITEMVMDVAEAAVETQAVPAANEVGVEEFVQQTMELNVEEAPAEVVETEKPVKNTRKKKTETANGVAPSEDKPAKPRRAPSKKKVAPVEEQPAEDAPSAEASAESAQVTVADVTAEAPAEESAPVKTAKPRTRKPRAKKPAEPVETNAIPAEGEKTETA